MGISRSTSLVVSVCIAVMLVVASVAMAQETILVQDFEDFADTEALREMAPRWEDGAFAEVFLCASIANTGDYSMRLVPGKDNQGQTWVSVRVPCIATDWTGGQYLEFWLKNDGATEFGFAITVYEESGEPWTHDASETVSIEVAEGEFEEVVCSWNMARVPAGFAGRVRVPFDSLTVASWFAGDARDDEFAADSIREINLGFSMANNPDNVLYLDSFQVVK